MKYLLSVIILSLICAFSSCTFNAAQSNTGNQKNQTNSDQTRPQSFVYEKPRRLATIKDEAVSESSGIVASRTNPGVFWTHNDSGDGAFLYAFDKTGKKLGVWKIENAKNIDWEDIAAYTDKQTGENYLLLGDIGNNNLTRSEVIVYKISEPKIVPADADSTKKKPRLIKTARKIIAQYPNARRDAETLIVNPVNGDLYVLSKNLIGPADVYKLAAPYWFDKKQTLEQVGQILIPSLTAGMLTGGDISADGTRLIVCDYFAGYEFVLPNKAKSFDDIWQTESVRIDLGERAQGEAVCYSTDGRAIYATSEKKPSPLNEVLRK